MSAHSFHKYRSSKWNLYWTRLNCLLSPHILHLTFSVLNRYRRRWKKSCELGKFEWVCVYSKNLQLARTNRWFVDYYFFLDFGCLMSSSFTTICHWICRMVHLFFLFKIYSWEESTQNTQIVWRDRHPKSRRRRKRKREKSTHCAHLCSTICLVLFCCVLCACVCVFFYFSRFYFKTTNHTFKFFCFFLYGVTSGIQWSFTMHCYTHIIFSFYERNVYYFKLFDIFLVNFLPGRAKVCLTNYNSTSTSHLTQFRCTDFKTTDYNLRLKSWAGVDHYCCDEFDNVVVPVGILFSLIQLSFAGLAYIVDTYACFPCHKKTSISFKSSLISTFLYKSTTVCALRVWTFGHVPRFLTCAHTNIAYLHITHWIVMPMQQQNSTSIDTLLFVSWWSRLYCAVHIGTA